MSEPTHRRPIGRLRGGPSAHGTKVLLAATSYPADRADWKGLFIQRMVEGLQRRPDLVLSTWCPPGPRPDGVASALAGDDGAWLSDLAAQGGIAHLLRRQPLRGVAGGISLVRRLHRAMRASDADVFHLNWLQNALALPADGRPALVTALGTDMQLLKAPFLVPLLRQRFSRRQVVLCPNADWMVPVLQSHFGDMARVECVPFGIDGAWYAAPHVPATPPRWLCVTRITAVKLGPLFEWAAPLFQKGGRALHVIGPRQEGDVAFPEWVHFHGPQTPQQLVETWFPQATGLISLSRHPEGRPQVMLEAMAAGLPVVASRLPAHEDLVAHGKSGWICDDPAGLAEALAHVEERVKNQAMSDRAREIARQRFGDWDDCAARYARQYEWLIGGEDG